MSNGYAYSGSRESYQKFVFFHPLAPNIPPSSALGSIDHFLIALQLSSVTHPHRNISIPVHAIIAALSVQSLIGGNKSSTSGNPRAPRKDLKLQRIVSKLSRTKGFGSEASHSP